MRCFLSLLTFLSSLYLFTDPAIALKDTQHETSLIETYQSDVTGDGQNEIIELKGIRLSADTNYYQDVWVEITSNHNKHWKVNYGGGYHPSIQLIDLNKDQTSDIFYQSTAKEGAKSANHQLHTLINGDLNEIAFPEQLYIDGKFTDNFHVSIKLSPDSKPFDMDVKDQAETYERQGIYDKQGKLLKATSVLINPSTAFEPFIISESKGYGLKSYKQVNGGYQNDQLGTVETTWYFENNDWIILQSTWIPVNE